MQSIRPADLTSLRGLELKARSIVDGFLAGLHASPLKGASLDFAEHREYAAGDDLRKLDWKVLGSKDKLFIRQYREESTLTANILLDVSGSMNYSSPGLIKKNEYAANIAASLAYLMSLQHDRVGFLAFAEGVLTLLPPRAAHGQASAVIKAIEAQEPSGKTAVFKTLEAAGKLFRRRGLVILISDLYDSGGPEEAMKYLKYLASKGNDLIVFQVLDRSELGLELDEPFLFEGLEDKDDVILANPELIRHEYRRVMEEFIGYFAKECVKNGIDYRLLDNSASFSLPLRAYLARREKMLK